MPYKFANRFYLQQFIILVISGLVFFALSRYARLDLFLSDLWYDPQTSSFPLKQNYWLAVVNHYYVKYFVIALSSSLLILGVILRRYHWIVIALIIASGPLVIGWLKSFSHHSCPWDLIRYGGQAYEYPLLGHISEFPGRGRCFPGGHASGGFGLMAFYFVLYPISSRVAKWSLVFGIGLGTLMGFGQVMRGAHFFTHNLWAMWWVWLIQVSLYYLYTWWYYLPYRMNRRKKV
ncbi:phosphatase PAP2 family protein [Celerinatantimonas sp. YJH-8]|uniref:phosphatase PAP2 family protein n=1 Tax=Celerinatantimonas sp. YJH-8 TaxID=3228714 RepID=UPI0038C808FA